jgi:hypothetical protein
MSKERLERRASGMTEPSTPRNTRQPKHAEEEGMSPSPEELARQFLSDAIRADAHEAPGGRAPLGSARRDASALPDEVTRTRRRPDLRGDEGEEGSLFDDEGEELGEVRSPELDADGSPTRVKRERTPRR